MVTKPTIAMIGADMNAKGGVASVIRLYEEAGLFKHIKFLASYTDGNPLQKVTFYIRFLINFIALLVGQPSIQVIHIHTSSYGSFFRKSLVALLAKLFNKKPIIHMHGAGFNVFYHKMPFLIKLYIRAVLRSCVALISLSKQWKQDLFKISGHPDIRVVYNPTVLREPVFNQEATPHQVEETVNFLFMGRLGQRKGAYDIVESARQIQANNVKINLYGDGEVDSIQKMVTQGGLTHKIAVRGWIDGNQKEETFRQANVLLLPSYHEGLPISILEAMAYGLPVVATDVGGISEAVQDGVNGYLIQPGDCDELANRIERLATSPELRHRMGQSGYQLASGKFSLPVIIRQLEELYAEFTH